MSRPKQDGRHSKTPPVHADNASLTGEGKLTIRPGKLKRSRGQKLRDRVLVAKMYLEGFSQVAIGKHIGVSQPTVFRLLRGLREEWLESSLIDINERKGIELAKLDKLEEELWAAWERSKRAELTKRVETTSDPDLDDLELAIATKNIRIEKQRDGDPRFLVQVQKCIDKRTEILGLNAPKQVQNQFDDFHIKIGFAKPAGEIEAGDYPDDIVEGEFKDG